MGMTKLVEISECPDGSFEIIVDGWITGHEATLHKALQVVTVADLRDSKLYLLIDHRRFMEVLNG